MHDEAGLLRALLDGPGVASAFSRHCTTSAMPAAALDGEPASKAGLGSHSMATWTPCASCGPCVRLRKGKGHVDADRDASRGDHLSRSTVRVPDTREVTMVPLNVSVPLAAAAAGAAIAVGAASAIPRLAAPMTSVASCVPPVVRLVCSNHCHGLTRRAPEDMQAQNTTVGPTCRRSAYHPAMSAVSTSKWCPIRCHTQPRARQCRRDKGAMEIRWRSRRSAP